MRSLSLRFSQATPGRDALREVREPRLGRNRRDRAVPLHGLENVLRHPGRRVVAAAERVDHAVAHLRHRLDAAHARVRGDRRVDHPRADRGDPDAVPAQLVAQRFGETQDGELRRAVGEQRLAGDVSGGGREVDHVTAAAALDHCGHEIVAPVDHAPKIDADDPVPIIQRHVEQARAQADAGVVHQDVDGVDPRVHRRGEVAHLVAISDVDPVCEHIAPDGADLLLGGGETGLVDVAEDQVGAAPRERQGRCLADAARAAGDECRLAVECGDVHACSFAQGIAFSSLSCAMASRS
jgi:hypothetical protein